MTTNYSPVPAYSIKSPALRAMAMKQERERRMALIWEREYQAKQQQAQEQVQVQVEATAVKHVDKRNVRATELVLGDRFIQSDRGSWYCQSQSDENKLYMVSPNHCSCPDHQYRKSTCKHIRGYRILMEKLDKEAREIKADLGW